MKQWERALGEIRVLAPDIPEIREPVQYLYRHIERLEATLKAMEMGSFATPHPTGSFGLGPNTWEVPEFVQTMAKHALAAPPPPEDDEPYADIPGAGQRGCG